jgi:hypothetical protein
MAEDSHKDFKRFIQLWKRFQNLEGTANFLLGPHLAELNRQSLYIEKNKRSIATVEYEGSTTLHKDTLITIMKRRRAN